MLGHRVVAQRTGIAELPGQAMGNVFHRDVFGLGVKQIEETT